MPIAELPVQIIFQFCITLIFFFVNSELLKIKFTLIAIHFLLHTYNFIDI